MTQRQKVLVAAGVGTIVIVVLGRRLVLAAIGGGLTAAGAWLLSRGFERRG